MERNHDFDEKENHQNILTIKWIVQFLLKQSQNKSQNQKEQIIKKLKKLIQQFAEENNLRIDRNQQYKVDQNNEQKIESLKQKYQLKIKQNNQLQNQLSKKRKKQKNLQIQNQVLRKKKEDLKKQNRVVWRKIQQLRQKLRFFKQQSIILKDPNLRVSQQEKSDFKPQYKIMFKQVCPNFKHTGLDDGYMIIKQRNSGLTFQNLLKLFRYNLSMLQSLDLSCNKINDEGWLLIMSVSLPNLQHFQIQKNYLVNLSNMDKLAQSLISFSLVESSQQTAKKFNNNYLSQYSVNQILKNKWINLRFLNINFYRLQVQQQVIENFWQIFLNYQQQFPKLIQIQTAQIPQEIFGRIQSNLLQRNVRSRR